jgi:lipopolysaccharide/colanic/teichoic acid biosynthesis glycosyltransferase
MLLAQVEGDRDRFYRETLQPFKLEGYCEYLHRRSWRSDLRVLFQTVLAVLWPDRIGSPGPHDLAEKPPGT